MTEARGSLRSQTESENGTETGSGNGKESGTGTGIGNGTGTTGGTETDESRGEKTWPPTARVKEVMSTSISYCVITFKFKV